MELWSKRQVGQIESKMKKNLKLVDLFSGAGGLSAGFHQAGFDVVAAVDNWQEACNSIQANHPNAQVLCTDVRKLDEKKFVKSLDSKIDIVIGGPSCQGFSTSGGFSRNGRQLGDERNSLFLEFVRLVDAIQPEWVVMENVTGLLLFNKGQVAEEIIKQFRLIGYYVVPIILLAADYGVPQLRRRVFFVGNRTKNKIPLPVPSHRNPTLWKNFALPFEHLSRIGNKSGSATQLPLHVSFADACADLPKLEEGQLISDVDFSEPPKSEFQEYARQGASKITNHFAFQLSEFDREAIRHLKPGENWRSLPDHLKVGRFAKIRPYDATTLLKRLKFEAPSYTITTKFNEATTGAFIHPEQNRTISVREAARLQSFRDDYVFTGSFRDIREQIGNAVPPLLAQKVAAGIAAELRRSKIKKARTSIEDSNYVFADPTLEPAELIGLKDKEKKPQNDAQLSLLS